MTMAFVLVNLNIAFNSFLQDSQLQLFQVRENYKRKEESGKWNGAEKKNQIKKEAK